MKEPRLFAILVSPSLTSGLFSALVVGVIVLGTRWPYLQEHTVLGVYFSGEYGLNVLFQRMNIALGAAFNSTLAYNIAAITFAVLVGLSIYVIMASFRFMTTEAQVLHDKIKFTKAADKRRVETILGLRIGLRVASLLTWTLYSIFFFNIVVPSAVALASETPSGGFDLNHTLEATLLLIIALHIHVVFVRLMALRPRLF